MRCIVELFGDDRNGRKMIAWGGDTGALVPSERNTQYTTNTLWIKPSFCGTILVAAVVAHLAHGAFDDGRNNFHLLEGVGGDLSSYREVLHIRDPIGVVYPDLVEAAGQMHLLWSNSARFPDFVKWGAVQGKDQVLHAKLGL